MKPPALVIVALVAGCATRPPVVVRPTTLALEMTVQGAGKVENAYSVGLVRPDSHLKMTATYSVPDFKRGNDRIAIIIDRAGQPPLRLKEYAIASADGRLPITVEGSELVATGLGRFGLRLQLDRWESATLFKTIKASEPVAMEARAEARPASAPDARFLPPSIGKGQLLSDMVNDPRYRPHLPPSLNIAGSVYWGLFKICVNTDGAVQSVQLLKSAHPDVDDAWVALIRTLEHRPYSVGDKLVPYCYPMRLEVRSVAATPQPPRR
jgi:hypothetical protein